MQVLDADGRFAALATRPCRPEVLGHDPVRALKQHHLECLRGILPIDGHIVPGHDRLPRGRTPHDREVDLTLLVARAQVVPERGDITVGGIGIGDGRVAILGAAPLKENLTIAIDIDARERSVIELEGETQVKGTDTSIVGQRQRSSCRRVNPVEGGHRLICRFQGARPFDSIEQGIIAPTLKATRYEGSVRRNRVD